MTFLAPLFLIGAAAAAIPIVLHLLKREPEQRVKFAAVKLLRHAPVEHSRKRHLRELLLLALRVAALLLLASAFARPFFTSGEAGASAGVTVVALDTSLSLSAPGQFDRAKALAKQAVDRAPRGQLVAVVTFADSAEVVVQPTPDRAMASAAIDAAAPGFGATRYRAAVAAAANLVNGSRGSSTIIVVTDLQESGWEAGEPVAVPESARLEVADVGELPPNLAVTAVRASAERIVATIRNTGARNQQALVEVHVDERLAGEATASVAPNQSTEVTLAGATGGTAAVSVVDREGVQADNVRYVVLDNASRPMLLVVTASGDVAREALYVQQALMAAGPAGAAYQVAGVGASQLSTWDQARVAGHAAVLVLSTRGLERRGRELLTDYVRKGGGILVAAGANVDGEVAADVLGGVMSLAPLAPERRVNRNRTLAPADVRHPIFQPFADRTATLGLAKFHQIAALGGDGCHPLARFTTGEPALGECALGEGRALVLASDLDNVWNDFPRHATFVPFLHAAVRYLAGGRPSAGEYLIAEVPPGVPAKPGIATRPEGSAPAAAPRRVAVNVDPAESEPGRLSTEEFQQAVTRVTNDNASQEPLEARQQEERQHIWQYVLALMVVMLAFESIVGARTA